jgi:metal-dependent amidase/aminoacylase/carboxypeptidase family protein
VTGVPGDPQPTGGACAPRDRLTRLRHHLHRHPELSGRETATAAAVARHFTAGGAARVLTGLAGHGVAAVFAGAVPGPATLIRAELDALPVTERSGVPHASTRPGTAHLCGHDGHLAILAGVADRLGRQPLAAGRVMLLCQPAEETGLGAAAVAAHPVLREFAPDRIFALHNLPGYPAGQIILRDGVFAAGSAEAVLTAADPAGHLPCAVAAELTGYLVTLPVAFERRGHRALVTVTGTGRSGSPLTVTLRADDDEVLASLRRQCDARAATVAEKHGLHLSCFWSATCPVVRNHPAATADIAACAARLGLQVTRPRESCFQWTEDFGNLLDLAPGAMFGLGAGRRLPQLHAPDFDFNDDLIPTGVAVLEALARR